MDEMQELRDYLASEVMGWAKDDYSKGRMNPEPGWLLANGEEILCKNWQPDTNANQALMLLEKTGLTWVFVSRNKPGHWVVELGKGQGEHYYQWTATAAPLALAICRAVKAWREAKT